MENEYLNSIATVVGYTVLILWLVWSITATCIVYSNYTEQQILIRTLEQVCTTEQLQEIETYYLAQLQKKQKNSTDLFNKTTK